LLATEYGWSVDYILDRPTRQITRLVSAIAERRFTDDIAQAELQEIAINRALANALGGTALPPWPTWDQVKEQQQRSPKLGGPMNRFKEKALA